MAATGEGTPTTTTNEVSWVVTFDVNTATGDETYLKDAPTSGTITLVEASLLGAGTATTIRPEFGTVAGWTTNEDGHVDRADAAAEFIRIDTNKRFRLRDGNLYVRPNPDADLDGTQSIELRVTVRKEQPV